jgi:hypothetical protein
MKIDNSNIGMATVGGHRAYAESLMKIDDSYINLAALKSVTLIERVKCEIVVVTRDEKHEVSLSSGLSHSIRNQRRSARRWRIGGLALLGV